MATIEELLQLQQARQEWPLISGIKDVMALPGDIASRIQAARSAQSEPGVTGTLRAFANPEPVLAAERVVSLRQEFPEQFQQIDAAIQANQPEVAQRLTLQLGAAAAARGHPLTELQPIAKSLFLQSAAQPEATQNPAQLIATGAAAGMTTPEKAGTGISLVGRRQAQVGESQAKAGLANERATRISTLLTPELQRTQAQTGQASAAAGLSGERATTERTLRGPREQLIGAQTGAATRANAGAKPLNLQQILTLKAQLAGRITGDATLDAEVNRQIIELNKLQAGLEGGQSTAVGSPATMQGAAAPTAAPAAGAAAPVGQVIEGPDGKRYRRTDPAAAIPAGYHVVQ